MNLTVRIVSEAGNRLDPVTGVIYAEVLAYDVASEPLDDSISILTLRVKQEGQPMPVRGHEVRVTGKVRIDSQMDFKGAVVAKLVIDVDELDIVAHWDNDVATTSLVTI